MTTTPSPAATERERLARELDEFFSWNAKPTKADVRAIADMLRADATLQQRCEALTKEVAEWKRVVWAVADPLKCLPSTFADANDHIIRSAKDLRAQLDRLTAERDRMRTGLIGIEQFVIAALNHDAEETQG